MMHVILNLTVRSAQIQLPLLLIQEQSELHVICACGLFTTPTLGKVQAPKTRQKL